MTAAAYQTEYWASDGSPVSEANAGGIVGRLAVQDRPEFEEVLVSTTSKSHTHRLL
jgi:hypothetical protein